MSAWVQLSCHGGRCARVVLLHLCHACCSVVLVVGVQRVCRTFVVVSLGIGHRSFSGHSLHFVICGQCWHQFCVCCGTAGCSVIVHGRWSVLFLWCCRCVYIARLWSL